jgi:hypothetical protein
VGIVAGLPLAIVVALVGFLIYDVHEQDTPPDVRATALSAAVVQSDAVATNAVSAELARLARGSSWLTSGPSAVSDICSSRSPDTIGASWGPVTCVREVIRFYAFDGTFPQRYASLAAELSGAPVERNPGALASGQTLDYSSVGPDGLSLDLEGRFADSADASAAGSTAWCSAIRIRSSSDSPSR